MTHLTLSAVVAASRADLTLVPYRGGAQQATDLVAGTVEGSADLPAALMPLAASGRVKLLGISSGARLGLLPDVPAFAETPGLQGIDIRSWNMIVAPAATPEAEVARLHAAIRQVGGAEAFRAALRPFGYDSVVSESPAAAAALVRSETPKWQRLVRESGAQVN